MSDDVGVQGSSSASRIARWIAGLGAAAALVLTAGRYVPTIPGAIHELPGWVRQEGALLALLVVLRYVALALIAWLALTTVLALGARLLGDLRAICWADALLLPVQRRMLGAGLAAGLTAGLAVANPLAASASRAGSDHAVRAAPPVTMTVIDPAVRDPAVRDPTVRDPTAREEPPPTEAMTVEEVTPRPAAPPPDTWTIRPGDHLWGVARATLANRGLDRSDAATASYLQTIIEANAEVFVVPGEPDLVYAGQVFVLPDPTAP